MAIILQPARKILSAVAAKSFSPNSDDKKFSGSFVKYQHWAAIYKTYNIFQ